MFNLSHSVLGPFQVVSTDMFLLLLSIYLFIYFNKNMICKKSFSQLPPVSTVQNMCYKCQFSVSLIQTYSIHRAYTYTDKIINPTSSQIVLRIIILNFLNMHQFSNMFLCLNSLAF